MPIAQHSVLTQIAFRSTRPGVAKPIARLRSEPTEIAEQLDLAFESAEDDLDVVDIASFSTPSGRQFSLVRHRHQIEPGTDILTDEKSVSITEDLADALTALRLDPQDLTWKHPDVNEKLLTFLCSMNAGEKSLNKLYDLQSEARGESSERDTSFESFQPDYWWPAFPPEPGLAEPVESRAATEIGQPKALDTADVYFCGRTNLLPLNLAVR